MRRRGRPRSSAFAHPCREKTSLIGGQSHSQAAKRAASTPTLRHGDGSGMNCQVAWGTAGCDVKGIDFGKQWGGMHPVDGDFRDKHAARGRSEDAGAPPASGERKARFARPAETAPPRGRATGLRSVREAEGGWPKAAPCRTPSCRPPGNGASPKRADASRKRNARLAGLGEGGGSWRNRRGSAVPGPRPRRGTCPRRPWRAVA